MSAATFGFKHASAPSFAYLPPVAPPPQSRANKRFSLKKDPLKRADLNDFVTCYKADNRGQRVESERFHAFTYAELMARDKVNLDIFLLKDENLEDADNLPAPEVIAAEIIENLEAALEQFRGVAEELER